MKFIQKRKFLTAVAVVVAVGGGWWLYSKATTAPAATRYVLGTVSRGTIVSAVSASGQVSTSNQSDLKPKASGDLTWVGVKAGDQVRAGQAIAQIDNRDALQAISDAETNLKQSQLQYQKDSAQAPIDFSKSQETLADANTTLQNTYNDIYNTLSNSYLDLPAVVTGMQDALYATDLSTGHSQSNIDFFRNSTDDSTDAIHVFIKAAESDYLIARPKYDKAILDFKTLTRYSSTTDSEKLLTQSTDVATSIAQALQSELNLLDAVVDDQQLHNRTVNTAITTLRTNTRTRLSTANATLTSLLNQQKALDTNKKAVRDAERSIELLKIGNPTGSTPISLQSSEYSIADQERKISDLRRDLSNYVVTAPYAGTIATFTAHARDSVSTGTVLGTLISTQKLAELSLNEVDAAKIKLGNKVTLTFDAIDGLTLTGSVIELDPVGTVTQGVVSYKLKISLDSVDERVKAGMTVNAAIQTATRQDVLVVPASAVKTQNGASYVLVFNPPLDNTTTGASAGVTSLVSPEQKEVQVGISDDSSTEIVSGLAEGDQVVVRTISATTAAATQSAPSLFGGLGGGGNRGAGGGARTTGAAAGR